MKEEYYSHRSRTREAPKLIRFYLCPPGADESEGPYTFAQLQMAYRREEVEAGTQVWNDDDETWCAIEDLEEELKPKGTGRYGKRRRNESRSHKKKRKKNRNKAGESGTKQVAVITTVLIIIIALIATLVYFLGGVI